MRYVYVLVERRCTGCKYKWSSLLENNVYLQRLNGITICVIFVYAMPLAGTKLWERFKCFEYKLWLLTCFRFECKIATANVFSNRVQNCNWLCPSRTRAANAYTKRGIENSFPSTQMFVQARNKKCLQQKNYIELYHGFLIVTYFWNLECN